MFSFEWGNPIADPMSIFMMFTVLIPPLRTYLGGWENFTPDEGRTWELIGASSLTRSPKPRARPGGAIGPRPQCHFVPRLVAPLCLAQFFLVATASVIITVWFSHRDGYVKLSPGDLRAANWYLLCGAYIHFLMDGLVGCYGVWGLMRRAYETLDGRFPHAPSPDADGRRPLEILVASFQLFGAIIFMEARR
ncbi:hypothetical protein FNF27_06196 [Cafeteria roenbergensis]|uniref:EXPERA domain-containing protein n=1 Tax=Cafeteria roenbergensis TaxID=33653 RepID=A0A5A8E294_CAFRO|nr:hypothetical protein FNF27_06196 [Cafeteria roenbergensis]